MPDDLEEKLPKTAAALKTLLGQAKLQHLDRLDRNIDDAIRKVWASLLTHSRH